MSDKKDSVPKEQGQKFLLFYALKSEMDGPYRAQHATGAYLPINAISPILWMYYVV